MKTRRDTVTWWECCSFALVLPSGWHSYTFTTWIAVDTTRNCRLQSWTLHKSADCRWISITILYVSFTNSATVQRLEQVQLCNRLIDQSADNITGLKCAKECLILKYKYIQNPWFYCSIFDHDACMNLWHIYNSYTPRTLRECYSQSKFRILKMRESSARALFLYNCTPNISHSADASVSAAYGWFTRA